MRKHLSVLALWYRLNFKRTAFLLSVMAASELALFARALYKNDPATPVAMETLLENSYITTACMLAFVYIVVEFYHIGDRNTLGRLSIREEAVALWHGAYNGVCLLLFWAVQAMVILVMCLWYVRWLDPAYVSAQTVVLAIYRIPFFNRFFPLADWLLWLGNILLAAELAFSPACAGLRYRRGSRNFAGLLGLVLMLLTVLLSASQLIELQLLPLFAAVIFGGADVAYFLKRWRGEPDEE